MDEIDEEMLLNAIRQRILQEIQSGASTGGQAHSPITYNVYGPQGQAPVVPEGPGGVYGALSEGGGDEGSIRPEELDYFVDIVRRDVIEDGEKVGWDKSVHRYSQPKKKSQ